MAKEFSFPVVAPWWKPSRAFNVLMTASTVAFRTSSTDVWRESVRMPWTCRAVTFLLYLWAVVKRDMHARSDERHSRVSLLASSFGYFVS